MNDIYKFVENRLNIKIDNNNNFSILKFSKISKLFTDTNFKNFFSLPNNLFDDVNDLIKKYYENESKTKIKNRIEIALYIVIIIYNNIFKDDDDIKQCFSNGVQISKEIFSSVLSNSYLYEIKKILLDNNIIHEQCYDLMNKKYSIKNKLAIKYCLNEKYNNNLIVLIENKYVFKFIALFKNGLLYGSKRKSLNSLYLPYESFEKNIQYVYQKNMYFNEEEFNKILIKKYKNIASEEQSIRKILNCFKSLNSHIFKTSESFGRIYMPFQYIQSDFRKCIRIGNNEELIEAYDIKCCFVFLAAKMFLCKNLSDDLNIECEKIIKLCNNDIYKEILKYNNQSYKKENRKNIKSNVMKWLFSNKQDRHASIKMSPEVFLIDNFFKMNFPLFYHNVIFYEEDKFFKNKNGKIIKVIKSKLPFECFKFESNIMFTKVLPYLHNKYEKIPFISLHDGIFIPKRFEYLINEIKNDIIHLI